MTLKRTLPLFLLPFLGFVLVVGRIGTTQVESPPEQQAEATAEPQGTSQQFSFPGQTDTFQQSLSGATESTSISALGSVEANQVAGLQFQTTGTVAGVYVEVGDYIQAGEVLADVDATDQWSSYHQALLNLESANIAMQKLLQPPSESDLAVAQANVTSAQASYNSVANATSETDLNAAQMKYDQALAQLQALQDERAHMNGTDEQIALAEAKIGSASFNAEIARLQLEKLQTPNSSALWSASLRIQQAQLQLDQLQEPPAQSDINSAQLAIDRAQQTVLNAQTTLQQTQLIAPVSGYVTAVNITSGASVAQSTVALEISDTSNLQMTVPINELDIGKVTEGAAVTIQLDALPDLNIPGTVQHVGWIASTSSDGIVTYDVQVVLNTDDPRVRIGMTGEVTIETGSTGS